MYPIDCMAEEGEEGYALEVRGLVLDLEGRRVLDGVDICVRRGETLCLLGPSGAGKSMLLRTLVRLHEPTSGTVVLEGRDVCELDPTALRRRMNLVQQSSAMLEGTVEENLRYGPELAGVPPTEIGERIGTALEDASLDGGFLFRRAEKLSGGEKQRVAIARSLAMRPDILLLDEPTVALDPRSRRTVEDTILRLKDERGMTMVIVTHDVEQSMRLGDRTALLRRGKVIAVESSDALLDRLDPEDRTSYLGELERWDEEHEEVQADE